MIGVKEIAACQEYEPSPPGRGCEKGNYNDDQKYSKIQGVEEHGVVGLHGN